jgi:hypothetical protein
LSSRTSKLIKVGNWCSAYGARVVSILHPLFNALGME